MRLCCLKVCSVIFILSIGSCRTDDSPGFFLKITKNVPRLGRRSDKTVDSNFLQSYKTIPRIGRSAEDFQSREFSALANWLNEPTYLRPLNKRVLMHPARMSSTERELSVVQPVNTNTLRELLDKDAIPSDNVKFVHWKDFDLALQLDMDLYGKVISLGRRPDQRLKQDLNIGSYIPFFNKELDELGERKENDFKFYNRPSAMDETFPSDLLNYNRL